VRAASDKEEASGQGLVTYGEIVGQHSDKGSSATASSGSSGSGDNGCSDVAPKGSTCQQQKVRREGAVVQEG
jgi:hypothetical protein